MGKQPQKTATFKRQGKKLDLKHLSPDGTRKIPGPQPGFKTRRQKKKSNEQLSRTFFSGQKEKPSPSHQAGQFTKASPRRAFAESMAGAELAAQPHIVFLQREAGFAVEPGHGLNWGILARLWAVPPRPAWASSPLSFHGA